MMCKSIKNGKLCSLNNLISFFPVHPTFKVSKLIVSIYQMIKLLCVLNLSWVDEQSWFPEWKKRDAKISFESTVYIKTSIIYLLNWNF